MARVSPIVKSQNAGEWSAFLEGRIDLAKYPASLRRAYNAVVTPQGPTLRRSGTKLQVPLFDESKIGWLLPFIFSNDQAMQVEVASGRFRWHTEEGLLAYPATSVTAIVPAAFIVVTSPGHGIPAIGHQVVLEGFDVTKSLNGRVATVNALSGDDVGLDIPVPAGGVGALTTAKIAHVYHIVSPYLDSEIPNLRYVGDQDTLFLFTGTQVHKKLQRFDTYDWRITDIVSVDGPYAPTNDTSTTLTPNGNNGMGNIIPTMTSATTPSGVASADTENSGNEAWHAFDSTRTTYWTSTQNQAGILEYQLAAPAAVTGYLLEIPDDNDDATYTATDYAPSNWLFQGSPDGSAWTTLDTQIGYVLYDQHRSAYFPLLNTINYSFYRIVITQCVTNGPINPRVATFALTAPNTTSVVFDASATTNINSDQGFLPTDVGRLVRFQGADSIWRPFRIDIVNGPLQVLCHAMADPLLDFSGTTNWRLGMFSNTTGFPTCGTFFEDRLIMGGVAGYPDYIVGSVTGKYQVMQQTNTNGQVVDDNALVLKLNARKQGRVVWLTSDLRSLLVGTGSSEWVIASADPNAALSALTAKARPASRRGSANAEPVQIDSQSVFIQRTNRTIREIAYVFQIDGYAAPSLTLFANHLGTPRFQQLEFALEPYSLVFARRGDGTVTPLTYIKEQDVTAWQVFDFNGVVECVSVIPAEDGTQDALWMIVRRSVGGVTRRFVERLTRFWDFDSTILDAIFVDACAVYDGEPATTIYGLHNYEGATLCGLADGSPIPPTKVVNAQLTLDVAASKVVLGIPYDSDVETSRPEAGATSGTAQGKLKRINEMRLRLWESGGGEYAVRGVDGQVTDYVPLEYLTPDTPLDGVPALFTGDTEKLDMPQAFSTEGTILYRQRGEIPLPFNVVALLPKLETQDNS